MSFAETVPKETKEMKVPTTKPNHKDEGVKIVGGRCKDVMYLLQMSCNQCGFIYFCDIRMPYLNGVWLDGLTCPNCKTSKIVDKDPSTFHVYNLDCIPYEIVE